MINKSSKSRKSISRSSKSNKPRKSISRSSKSRKNRKNKKHSGKRSGKDYNVQLDITDKSLIDFKENKSISVASSISELKSSKIGELYDVKPIHDNMQRLCQNKIQAKSQKTTTIPLPKHVSKQICECLFEKNKNLSILELEKRVSKKEETPASHCITILDNYTKSP